MGHVIKKQIIVSPKKFFTLLKLLLNNLKCGNVGKIGIHLFWSSKLIKVHSVLKIHPKIFINKKT